MTLRDRDVVIVGAGPTGLMLAGELKLAGVDVAVVERRASQEVAGSRASGLHPRTLEVLDQRGLAERFVAQGQKHFAVPFGGVMLDARDRPTRFNYSLGLLQGPIERTLADTDRARWRLPFCHHPPFCAGPQHRNTDRMDRLLPLFAAGGIRAVFSGHEHNFQHSRSGGIDYFVTGAGSKVRKGPPTHFEDAHTLTWADSAHFLLVTIAGDAMTIRVCGELGDTGLTDVTRYTPGGGVESGSITIIR